MGLVIRGLCVGLAVSVGFLASACSGPKAPAQSEGTATTMEFELKGDQTPVQVMNLPPPTNLKPGEKVRAIITMEPRDKKGPKTTLPPVEIQVPK